MNVILQLLPWTGIAALAWAAVATWRWTAARADARRWKTACRLAQSGEQNALGLLADMQRAVNSWKAMAAAGEARARKAQEEAATVQARFDRVAAELACAEVPPDTEGALAWLQGISKKLAAEVGR